MAKVENSIIINAPVEKVFTYLDDVEKNVEWLPGMVEVKDIHLTDERVGSHFQWVYKMVGIRMSGETTTTEYVPNRRVVTKSKGGITSTWTFTFDAHNGGTKLTILVEYTVPIPVLGKIVEALVLKQNDREAKLSLENIKAATEAER